MVVCVIIALIALVMGTDYYYKNLSQAARAAVRVPQDAEQEDVAKLVKGRRVGSEDIGKIRVVSFRYPDYSLLRCTFVGVEEPRTRKTLKYVEVTKMKKQWRQVGWNYFGYPEYDWVEVPYATTELQPVEETYEVTVWKAREARAGLDTARLRRSVGLQ